MKSPRILTLLFALGVGALAPAAQDAKGAKAASGPKAPEWAELFGGASLAVVWQSAHTAAKNIAVAIEAKSFENVSAWAETVHLAAHALEDQVKLGDAERQRRLEGALAQAARIADQVIGAANQKEPEKLADAFRRMNAALQLVASRLPKEIVDAPPQNVRFAKGDAHTHDDKRGADAKKK